MPLLESGHAPSRVYTDQDGNFHLNGSSLYLDEVGTKITSPSSRLVNATAAFTVSQATHDGTTILLNNAAGFAVTLPAASGSGLRLRFFVATTVTSVGTTIVATGAHIFGRVYIVTDTTAGTLFTTTSVGASGTGITTITLNGTTTGGLKGDWLELEDVATNTWSVRGFLSANGTEATPFS